MKADGAHHPQNRIDTLIGAEMQVEGNIACNGVLRLQGSVKGNITCQDSASGAVVVDSTGKLAGTTHAPHVIVKGQVQGPVQSSQSVEISQGGCVEGDIAYKEIAIQAGGIVKGLLTANATPSETTSGQPASAARLIDGETILRSAKSDAAAPRSKGKGMFGLAALLAAGIAVVAWVNRDALTSGPAESMSLPAPPQIEANNAEKAPPATETRRQDDPNTAATIPPSSPSQEASGREAAQSTRREQAEAAAEKIITVKGLNPSRPADVFLLISNEASVLFRKKREDPADGMRIAFSQGERVSITVAPNELFRIAKGRDIVIFYQGQKVPQNVIDSGAWLNFSPRLATDPGTQRAAR